MGPGARVRPPTRRRRHLAALALAAFATLPARAQTVPTVAAASDLQFAVEELAAAFERTTGHRLRLVFGSSGQFKTQILQGAPFHLFMSADEGFVFQLADAGKTEDRGRAYARGRIGIMVPPGSPLKADGELKDLAAALKDGRLQKLAIANPEHAPYGARAKRGPAARRPVAGHPAASWCSARTSRRRRSLPSRGRRRAASSRCRWRWRRRWPERATFALPRILAPAAEAAHGARSRGRRRRARVLRLLVDAGRAGGPEALRLRDAPGVTGEGRGTWTGRR
jgi:hypothetical protein